MCELGDVSLKIRRVQERLIDFNAFRQCVYADALGPVCHYLDEEDFKCVRHLQRYGFRDGGGLKNFNGIWIKFRMPHLIANTLMQPQHLGAVKLDSRDDLYSRSACDGPDERHFVYAAESDRSLDGYWMEPRVLANWTGDRAFDYHSLRTGQYARRVRFATFIVVSEHTMAEKYCRDGGWQTRRLMSHFREFDLSDGVRRGGLLEELETICRTAERLKNANLLHETLRDDDAPICREPSSSFQLRRFS